MATLCNEQKTNFSNKDKAYQRFILDEFIKYAQQARDLFTLTQGTNWDTTTFNDPYLVFKKQVQLSKAIELSSGTDPQLFAIDNSGNSVPAAMALIDNTFLKHRILLLRKTCSICSVNCCSMRNI